MAYTLFCVVFKFPVHGHYIFILATEFPSYKTIFTSNTLRPVFKSHEIVTFSSSHNYLYYVLMFFS